MEELISIEQITAEIIILKNQTAQNIIEIGKRLIQAKENIPHGQWGDWLSTKVDFSHKTANRFMQVAKELPNSSALTNLSQTKVFALLDLPEEQREDFLHANPVEEMTTRELQKAIKAQKDAEAKAKDLESLLEDQQRMIGKLRQSSNKEPEKIIVEKVVQPPDYMQIKQQVTDLENMLMHRNTVIAQLDTKANKSESELKRLKSMLETVEQLKAKKDGLVKHVEAATEISYLVTRIEHVLYKELAPVKYTKSITLVRRDPLVQRNLKDILGRVQSWCTEISAMINYDDELAAVDYVEVDDE